MNIKALLMATVGTVMLTMPAHAFTSPSPVGPVLDPPPYHHISGPVPVTNPVPHLGRVLDPPPHHHRVLDPPKHQ